MYFTMIGYYPRQRWFEILMECLNHSDFVKKAKWVVRDSNPNRGYVLTWSTYGCNWSWTISHSKDV